MTGTGLLKALILREAMGEGLRYKGCMSGSAGGFSPSLLESELPLDADCIWLTPES